MKNTILVIGALVAVCMCSSCGSSSEIGSGVDGAGIPTDPPSAKKKAVKRFAK